MSNIQGRGGEEGGEEGGGEGNEKCKGLGSGELSKIKNHEK